jgi:XTP/dITP diphosphohydrolase
MNRLLLATSNRGKIIEYHQILNGLPYEFVSLEDLGIKGNVKEDYPTYRENALHKASAYAEKSGLMTLADDSGLEVDVLGGQPGVLSARYAGENATDADRVNLLLSNLKDVPLEKRTAKFVCVIALTLPGVKSELYYGECKGLITFKPAGENGFGYDPVFYFTEMNKTMAELPPEIKNRVSHRGKAAEGVYKALKEYLEMR